MAFLVAIPVYNERELVRRVMLETMKYADAVLAVDDGSDDGTGEILKRIPCLRLVQHKCNRGYGKTLLDCFDYAIQHGFEIVVTIDCDLQHNPRHILDFVNAAKDTDIVSGSRYLPDSKIEGEAPPPERLKINRLVTERIKEITGYHITDAFCGYKGYRSEALRKLNLTEPGYAMPLQLWIQAWKNGLTVKELPVDLIYRDLSRAFPDSIADSQRRLKYYNDIINRELASQARMSVDNSAGAGRNDQRKDCTE